LETAHLFSHGCDNMDEEEQQRITEQQLTSANASRSALEAAVQALSETVRVLNTAIFGRWDGDRNVQVPGMHQDIVQLQQRFTALERIIRRIATWVIIPLAVLCGLKALGVPTDIIGKLIVSFVQRGIFSI
jgi:hypothetical protein